VRRTGCNLGDGRAEFLAFFCCAVVMVSEMSEKELAIVGIADGGNNVKGICM
jgi:hypothetical protein